jgi:hypothetical protein
MKNYVAVPALCLLACCSTPRPAPAPAPPTPAAAPRPAPPPPAAPRWEDWPYTPGTWRYEQRDGGSTALFGPAGGAPLFSVRCVAATRTVAFVRAGQLAATTFAFTTSSGTAAYAGEPSAEGLLATTRASDPYLDKIAFSRGRFVVAVAGAERLVLPSWAEVARVIEDCR